MLIGILLPQPVPFVHGGAEKLAQALAGHIERATPHAAEIVSILTPERTLDEIVEGYHAFHMRDFSRYDHIVSLKYPAWMARHESHSVYMLHRLRGLYETYPGDLDDTSSMRDLPAMRRLYHAIETMEAANATGQLADPDRLFDAYRQMRAHDVPDFPLRHPGPLARRIVHALDGHALSCRRIRRYAAISRTVATRRDYFPAGAEVTVGHPPAPHPAARRTTPTHFFTCSRLDHPKRIGLLIEAMRHVEANIALLIAGTGPLEMTLKVAAAADPRIRFLGHVPDEALGRLYAGAIAVPFVPADEDYGFIAIEAMQAGVPVLTTHDSGGPCELVEHSVTGWIVPPEARAIGRHLAMIAADPAKAVEIGRAARSAVAAIGWPAVVQAILPGDQNRLPATPRRRRIVVAASFPIGGARSGGALRALHLYRRLARQFDIDLVTLASREDGDADHDLAPGLCEQRFAKSPAHEAAEKALSARLANAPVGDIGAHLFADLSPDFLAALKRAARRADGLIACHPYLADALLAHAPDKPFALEAQDVEQDMKSALYPDDRLGRALLTHTAAIERDAWRRADFVFACATRDLDRLCELYGPGPAERHVLANGVDIDAVPFTPMAARQRAHRARTLLFLGSRHPPNIDAAQTVIDCAPRFAADAVFLIAGTVCAAFAHEKLPANVALMGLLDEATLGALLAGAHLALNPMRHGSGTNLKMLDYAAAGLPIVSTTFGLRGLPFRDGIEAIETPDDDFAKGLERALSMDARALNALARSARSVTEEHHDWRRIGDDLARRIECFFHPNARAIARRA